MEHARYQCEKRTKSRYKSKRSIPRPQPQPVLHTSEKRLMESSRTLKFVNKRLAGIQKCIFKFT